AVGKPEQLTASWQVRKPGGEWTDTKRSTTKDEGSGTSAGPSKQTTSTSIEISDVPASYHRYEYRAVFTNETGTSTSKPAKLRVRFAPQVTEHPADTEVTDGDDATFTAVASANPKAAWHWESAPSLDGPWTTVPGSEGGTGSEASLTVSGV